MLNLLSQNFVLSHILSQEREREGGRDAYASFTDYKVQTTRLARRSCNSIEIYRILIDVSLIFEDTRITSRTIANVNKLEENGKRFMLEGENYFFKKKKKEEKKKERKVKFLILRIL